MVIAETVSFAVTSVIGIFNALDNTYLDGYSMLDYFLAMIFFDFLIEFFWRLITPSNENTVTPGTIGGK